MRQTFTLRRTRDGVVTFKYGRYVESFDVEMLGAYETYERIRYAAITAGLSLNDETMAELLREAKGLLDD